MEAITILRELEVLEEINESNLTTDVKMDLIKLIEFHGEFRIKFEDDTEEE